ncbi:hypothetical protein HID58_074390 [Brassica napus]|uniref:Uncharacterized protein n=2 Tax=Brassica napus TaxID=3708 RepID=A0ABQ7YGW1_BRANA|nr:hypothetical protein HID58_074390 [Brassica napus]
MVSQTNAARTSGRHRRRSTPTPRKQARPRTTNRYPVSDSDEDKTASSMDSTAPTSPPVDAVDDGSSAQLPRRLFGPGFFPTGLRLNIYSKANVIGAVASVLAEQLQNMARGIYERLETMERNICSHLGVSPPNVHHTRKRKAVDDNHGLSDSPKTVGIQKQRPPRKSRRTKSTVTKPATKIHSYPLRSADGLQVHPTKHG